MMCGCRAISMRRLALSLIFLAAVNVACAQEVFKVGVTTRDFIPAEPYDWRGAAHALRATIWYPAASDAREQAQSIGPRFFPLIRAGNAAPDAAPANGALRPLILLSHGNGGRADLLAWFGAALAAHGFIAVAVNHPGTTRWRSTPSRARRCGGCARSISAWSSMRCWPTRFLLA
jgi:predicted dienelactone hydrolase